MPDTLLVGTPERSYVSTTGKTEGQKRTKYVSQTESDGKQHTNKDIVQF